jgi:hypothetical protein
LVSESGRPLKWIRNEALVAELETERHDTKDALAILATLRETQTQHVLNIEHLLKELQQQPG